jgi:ribosomal protein L29
MAKHASTKELRNMPSADLQREARGLRADIAKQRMSLMLGKEKNSGVYRSAKRTLARMLTVAGEQKAEPVKAAAPVVETKPKKTTTKKKATSSKKAS